LDDLFTKSSKTFFSYLALTIGHRLSVKSEALSYNSSFYAVHSCYTRAAHLENVDDMVWYTRV